MGHMGTNANIPGSFDVLVSPVTREAAKNIELVARGFLCARSGSWDYSSSSHTSMPNGEPVLTASKKRDAVVDECGRQSVLTNDRKHDGPPDPPCASCRAL